MPLKKKVDGRKKPRVQKTRKAKPHGNGRWPNGRIHPKTAHRDGAFDNRPSILVKRKKTTKKGPGRPKGSVSSVPHSVTASVKAVIEEVVLSHKQTIHDAIVDGLESGPQHADRYLNMCLKYTDGNPDANLHLRTSFKEDEIANASRDLARKMASLFVAAQSIEPIVEATVLSTDTDDSWQPNA